ncbi:MAG: DUF5666 domain-containing protein [Patescibacteria group bacterium]|nr:DUF5666 domain-containing protein [Patescibacteria group bacterium]
MIKKYSKYIIWAAIAVVFFFGGMFLGKSSVNQAANRLASGGSFAQRFAARGGANGINVVSGTVLSKDAQSLTIALPNGNSEIVFYATSTPVEKPTPSSINSVATGSTVVISGTQNSDGSFTASSIQLRGSGQGPGGFGQ